jgi:DNA modification methylase
VSVTAVTGNPKLRGPQSPQSAWYRYYPGFSESFARDALSNDSLRPGEWVLDPWNGSGTTVSAANSLGINAHGYDLNPVMVLVAKGRCLDTATYSSLPPLTTELLRHARKSFDPNPNDPLSTWFLPRSIEAIRSIEAAVQKVLIDASCYRSLKDRGVNDVSDLAAFFYVGIFRTIRQLLRPFLTSNPTWVKRPISPRERIRPNGATVREIFMSNLAEMFPPAPATSGSIGRGQKVISVASSEELPLPNESVHCVLASPPYCTRIDYAVATSPELALLGYPLDADFDELRRRLIGTSTVPSVMPKTSSEMGTTCLQFLEALSRHTSKASSTYYYKNHVQYFHSIGNSLSEIARVLKPGGRCVLVVQDSYYKDLHNDLPTIVAEMAGHRHLRLRDRSDFSLTRTLAGINPGAKVYRNSFSAVESVLVFEECLLTQTASQTHSPCHQASR